MGKMAILVIDMLNDFVKGGYNSGAYCERGKNIVPRIKEVIKNAVDKGVPVIYCSDAHRKSDTELTRNHGRWGDHAMEGSEGAQIIKELPSKGMLTFHRGGSLDAKLDLTGHSLFNVEKGTYSGFYETALDQVLRRLNVSTIYITGLDTNICDTHTSAGAFFRGYNIVIIKDCVDACTQEDHERGLKNLEFSYGAKLKDSKQVIEDIQHN